MKVKNSIKADKKKGDTLVKRGGILYRINKLNPKRKERQPLNKTKRRQRA